MNGRLCIFLLTYSPFTCDTKGLTPAKLVFGKELHLPCDLLFCAPPEKRKTTVLQAVDFMDWLHHTLR
jgi:hypothetical protein